MSGNGVLQIAMNFGDAQFCTMIHHLHKHLIIIINKGNSSPSKYSENIIK